MGKKIPSTHVIDAPKDPEPTDKQTQQAKPEEENVAKKEHRPSNFGVVVETTNDTSSPYFYVPLLGRSGSNQIGTTTLCGVPIGHW